MHDDTAGTCIGCHTLHHRITIEAADIINYYGARGDAVASDLRFPGIDADRYVRLFAKPANDRVHAGEFVCGTDRFGTRPSGFSANIDDVGAGVDHRQGIGDGQIRHDIVAAV